MGFLCVKCGLVRDLRDSFCGVLLARTLPGRMGLTIGSCRRTGEFNQFNRVAETGSSSSERDGRGGDESLGEMSLGSIG
jgi:hypothetical protein